MADGLLKAILAIIRFAKDDPTDQAANLDSTFRLLLEESFELRKKIDNLAVIHKRNSYEYELFKVKLTRYTKFIKENIYQKTGTIIRGRGVLEELKKELKSLEEGFRKLAHAVDDEAAKASIPNTECIITESIVFVAFIASLFTGNVAAITTAGLGLASTTYLTMFGDGVCKAEIDELSQNLHSSREELAKTIADLDETRWKDQLSHPEN